MSFNNTNERSKLAKWLLPLLLVGSAVHAEITLKGAMATDHPGATISRHIYGQFSEHLGASIYDGIWVGPESDIPNVRGIRKDVVAALKDIKVPVVRWPGGCFADEYHWRDGIGPRDQRPVRKNNWWGGGLESNAFGTHEFFDFAQMIGSDAYISVNVASSTPTEMREWIEYLTSDDADTIANQRRANGREEPFKVDFIGIGNESWGCGGTMTPEYYANELRRFSAFFHKNGFGFHDNNDNNALRVASGANNLDTQWTKVVMTNAAMAMDAISLHFYTLFEGDWPKRNEAKATGFSLDQWHEILFQANRMEEVLQAHIEVMDQQDPEKRIGLYVDEWGTWYDVEEGTEPGFLYQQNTLRDALVAATTLNIFHRHTDRVRMANIAQTVNVLQAMLLTDGEKMAKTPTYYVFKMYVPFQDANFIPVDIKVPMIKHKGKRYPAVSVTAATGKDGRIHVGIANLSLDQNYTLELDLGNVLTVTEGTILTHAALDAHNIPGEQEQIMPHVFDAASVVGEHLKASVPSKSVVVLTLQ
ncbi:alpha-N-arabinofuranosidase [Aestuariicella hydrocarbonica]|uniref:non-reducing end alpha-L-arabinofuranosidase n=1 Tax=Pseudomaricurvus hydrocarbonicus TaxID=1470433 RepID=A0A9E5MN53_9GAMM|nr:alpha-L-arabinofuranosidase C-terminal domain-containing protein [Aestuariicella hydrocarbonica]NHO67331.1 alpha-N-arabinofuranosidase [Aestuariicella hydrocarbonica]